MLIRCRWDDDVVFKNQARGTEDKKPKEFVNDLLRSDFHKRFMASDLAVMVICDLILIFCRANTYDDQSCHGPLNAVHRQQNGLSLDLYSSLRTDAFLRYP